MTTSPVTRTLKSSRMSLMKVAVTPGLGAWMGAAAWLVSAAMERPALLAAKSREAATWEAGVIRAERTSVKTRNEPTCLFDDSKRKLATYDGNHSFQFQEVQRSLCSVSPTC